MDRKTPRNRLRMRPQIALYIDISMRTLAPHTIKVQGELSHKYLENVTVIRNYLNGLDHADKHQLENMFVSGTKSVDALKQGDPYEAILYCR